MCDILSWVEGRLGSPKYAEVVLGLLDLLVEMYGAVAQVDPACYEALMRVRMRVDEEYLLERKCLETLGMAQTLSTS